MMSDDELYAIYNTANGVDGYIALAKGLARYFNECQYRNEHTITYFWVQQSLSALAVTPKYTGQSPSKLAECLTEYSSLEVAKLLEPITELIAALTKWAREEAPYDYDITNQPIEDIISTIRHQFDDDVERTDYEICKDLFFSPAKIGNNYVYTGGFFQDLADASPDYDELIDPASMTERSKVNAENEYRERLKPLQEAYRYSQGNPMEILLKEVSSRIKIVGDGFIDKSDVQYDASFLRALPIALKLRTYIAYDDYALSEEDEKEYEHEYSRDGLIPAHNRILVDMPERKPQLELLKNMQRYILSGASLAKKINSASYSFWSAAYIAYTKSNYDQCIKHIQEAIPLTYADLSVSYYNKDGRIVEQPPPAMRYKDDEFLTVQNLTLAYVNNTQELHDAILRNTTKDPTISRSEMLLMPNMQQVVGVFQPAFITTIERAGKLINKHEKDEESVFATLSKIDLLWRAFFKKLHTMATEQKQHAVINASQSAILELTSLFELKISGFATSPISTNDINDNCNRFIATLPELSAFVASLGERVYNQPIEKEHALTKSDVTDAVRQALDSTPIGLKCSSVREIRESFDDVAASTKELADNTRPPAKSREDIIALVRDVRGAKIKGVTSYPKATEYVRRIAKPSDERFYKRCVWAREYARTHAKKTKTGQDKFWASIAQDAKPSAATQRAKAKRSGVPGIVPTLHN